MWPLYPQILSNEASVSLNRRNNFYLIQMLVASTAENNEVKPNWQQSFGHHFRAGRESFGNTTTFQEQGLEVYVQFCDFNKSQ